MLLDGWSWGEANNAEQIIMLADGNAELTQALGLELDGFSFGMGTRSQRYSMLVSNGIVEALNIEPAGGVDVSSAEAMLASL